MARDGWVNLSGKEYPVYATILALAHERGLTGLMTKLIQIPGPENEYTAIVEATAMFPEGRVFTDYGDASPRNCTSKVATALIRMASTRSKGRVLRDAIGLGETMLEELPGDEPESAGDRAAAVPAPRANGGVAGCGGCGVVLTTGRQTFCRQKLSGKMICPDCERGG